MATSRKIEVFSAGCAVCEDTIALINRLACPSCEVEILDMHQSEVLKKAKRYGIRSVPAVAVNGKLADFCAGRGPDETALRHARMGIPI